MASFLHPSDDSDHEEYTDCNETPIPQINTLSTPPTTPQHKISIYCPSPSPLDCGRIPPTEPSYLYTPYSGHISLCNTSWMIEQIAYNNILKPVSEIELNTIKRQLCVNGFRSEEVEIGSGVGIALMKRIQQEEEDSDLKTYYHLETRIAGKSKTIEHWFIIEPIPRTQFQLPATNAATHLASHLHPPTAHTTRPKFGRSTTALQTTRLPWVTSPQNGDEPGINIGTTISDSMEEIDLAASNASMDDWDVIYDYSKAVSELGNFRVE
ncbi:MAG: hypothetical protein M1812_004532 [Candelaria pacifica]|nr:MAG: hypothetical protein M1812_004532 [Candelaria pacifica]